MASLTKDLRRQLESTVVEARTIAEEGAELSLKHLAVEVPRPHDLLTSEEKKLRVSLRAHAKQLGDRLDERPARLIQAVAYEHWHRLLFARFLIENDLLLHPEHRVALSLDEVKEIALGEGREWVEVAADYAQRMLLRRVFQPEDPALRVSLPREKRLPLEAKLSSLPSEVFLADDSLGWVYQFWQKEAKETVDAELRSGVPADASRIPAKTQLFTEDYMVLFLLENTLGAWWTARNGGPELSGYTWTYLRLSDDGTPAAGTFDSWPTVAKDLRVLDPCMGSGHFLTFALPILARMRVAEEGLSLPDAICAALRDNLFGLELDPRCSQIAAFNLALTAWKLAGTHFDIPQLNLACSGLGINAKTEDWVKLAGDDGRAREEMRRLYSLFKDAPTLGSLIDPLRLQANVYAAGADRVLPLLEEALKKEQLSDEARELAIAAQGVLAAFRILISQFTVVTTNVPYLGRGKQDAVLAQYCAEFHLDAKADLATCFVDRCLRFCRAGGSTALVTPQNWWFASSFRDLRERILRTSAIRVAASLGEEAWQSFGDRGPLAALFIADEKVPAEGSAFLGLDALKEPTIDQKIEKLIAGPILLLSQSSQYLNPDHVITIAEATTGKLLRDYASSTQGIKTGDDQRFCRYFWEIERQDSSWRFYQSSVSKDCLTGGLEHVLRWEDDGDLLARRQGLSAWGKQGALVCLMRSIPVTRFFGFPFASSVSPVIALDPSNDLAVWCYCSSRQFRLEVRKVDKRPGVTNSSLLRVPFDLTYWQNVAAEKYPDGLPKPHSDDPTQWLFNGHPKLSEFPIQVAVARLVGYRWPLQNGSSFPDCPALNQDGLEEHAEADGIVCLTSLAGKASAADRLRALLSDAYGEEWSATKLAELLGRSESLEVWLRDRFFEEHCHVFHHPFIWHVWDGRNDGFHALVNYHKLDYKSLEKLIYSYLGDWISRQRRDLTSGLEGADGRLAAAEHLQNELKNILEGECSSDKTHGYDVFVRWKPVTAQPLGWDPDLNDGVRVNIRPWITEARLHRATKQGILRVTPNIKYGKDSGKEPASDPKEFPWFEDTRERRNDIHLRLDEKRLARGLA